MRYLGLVLVAVGLGLAGWGIVRLQAKPDEAKAAPKKRKKQKK